jgi:hypothetical protein
LPEPFPKLHLVFPVPVWQPVAEEQLWVLSAILVSMTMFALVAVALQLPGLQLPALPQLAREALQEREQPEALSEL